MWHSGAWPEALSTSQREGPRWSQAGRLQRPGDRKPSPGPSLPAHWPTPPCGRSSGQGPRLGGAHPPSSGEAGYQGYQRGGKPAGHEHPTASNQLQGQQDLLRTLEVCTWKTAFLLCKFSANRSILLKALFEHLLEFSLTMPASRWAEGRGGRAAREALHRPPVTATCLGYLHRTQAAGASARVTHQEHDLRLLRAHRPCFSHTWARLLKAKQLVPWESSSSYITGRSSF